jgi:hypothetical protein
MVDAEPSPTKAARLRVGIYEHPLTKQTLLKDKINWEIYIAAPEPMTLTREIVAPKARVV